MADQQQPAVPAQTHFFPVPEPRTSAWVKFALFLIFAAVGVAAFFYIQDTTRLRDQAQRLDEQIRTGTVSIAALKRDVEADLQRQNTLLVADLERQKQLIQTISDELEQQVENTIKKHSLAGNYRNYEEKWIIQQASYLLRMANTSLLLETSTASATRYLSLAAEVLGRKTIPEIVAIRYAVINQVSALRTYAPKDTQTIYLRLDALIEQLPLLPLSPNWTLDQGDADPADAGVPADHPVLSRILSLFRFRVEDELSIRSPQLVQIAKGRLSLAIEQAKVALLGRQAQPYTLATTRAEAILKTYFDTAHPQVRDFASNLAEMIPIGKNLTPPDISGPMTMLDNYRSQQEGELSLQSAATGGDLSAQPDTSEPQL